MLGQARDLISEQPSVSDFKTYKAEVYKYLQTNITQISAAYGPKFKTLYSFMDQTDDKLKQIGDFHSNADL